MKIDHDNLLNVHHLKQDIIRERQTCSSYLSKVVNSLNNRCTELIPNAKLNELTQLRDQFAKVIKLLTSKQEELESAISKKYNKIIDSIKRRATNVLTKKMIVERNYHHLEVALKVVPLPILSCEESLLSGILLANSALIDTVKAQDSQPASKLQVNQKLYLKKL